MLKKSLLSLAVTVTGSYGAIYGQVSQLPTYTYDYIIVGGGTAGNTLANRLTENNDVQVLVLEAGGSNEGVIGSIIPLLGPTLSPNTPYDWNYTTAPQSGFNGRIINYPRGRILGGSSSINFMVYNTGSKDDWDHISKVTCDPDWTWDAMAKYRDLNQKYVPPNDGHDDTNQYLPSAHSRNGMVPISLPGFPEVIDSRVLAAACEPEFASEFPFQLDMNTGNTIGVGWVQGSIGNGTRSSSATTYVGPDYIHRPNLHILLHAHATKILEATGNNNTKPTFNGVEFGTGPSSQRWQVTACKEVIVSAGVFNTPQLLMLSGIGDPAQLTSLGIPTRVNLPSVGKNMTDHVLLGNPWQVNNNDTIDSYFSPERFPLNIQEWNETNPHMGPFSWTVTNQMAWLRLPANDEIIKKYGDPSVGPTSAHFQIIWTNGWLGGTDKPDGNWMTILTNLISPTSRGNVTLKSTDPFDPPVIDLGFLTTSYDTQTMIYAIKLIKRFVTANAWKGFIISPWGPLGSAFKSNTSDEEIVKYIRTYAGSVLHAVGTAAMSPCGAQWGVLDPDLRVKGTNGLRVVDASAFPYVPTAHTQGPTYLLAEAAAKKIKQGCNKDGSVASIMNIIFV